jgi:hypothetical protein
VRNRFPGTCYRCDKLVPAGDGHFERYRGGWRTQHADCAIRARAAKATEAGTATTPKSGVVHESAVAKPFAQKGSA